MSLAINPFADALINTFVNARGEVSNNLDTSKSKVAIKVRKDREAKANRSAFLKDTKEMRKEIVFCRKMVGESRKQGMRKLGEERAELFKNAVRFEKRARQLQAEINSIAKHYNIK